MRFRRIRLFYNSKSGTGTSFMKVRAAVSAYWKDMAEDIAWYFPDSVDQSQKMLHQAIEDGADCVAVCGGDGTVRNICKSLVGKSVTVAVIPTGSGNGLARHYGIPTNPVEAVKKLADGILYKMDTGYVNGEPFFVSASVAWDAAMTIAYEQLPFRGIGSYVAAGFYEFFDYVPQPIKIILDNGEEIVLDKPFLLTVGNLSGWGGGAYINRQTDGADGILDLVAARQQDTPVLLSRIVDVFDSGLAYMPRVIHRKISGLTIERNDEQPIQLDGEIVNVGKNISVSVKPQSLQLTIPRDFKTNKLG